jgi:hypothetical protein
VFERAGYTLRSLGSRWKITVPRLEPAIIATRPDSPLSNPPLPAQPPARLLVPRRVSSASPSGRPPGNPQSAVHGSRHPSPAHPPPPLSPRRAPPPPAGDPVRSTSPEGNPADFTFVPRALDSGAAGINPPGGSRPFPSPPPRASSPEPS